MKRFALRFKAFLMRFCRIFFWCTGLFAFLMILLSFSDLPYYAYHGLGTSSPELKSDPALIVILGGAGMPSPDGLIRTYYGAEAGRKYRQARIIIALPYHTDDSLEGLNLMAHELILRGIDSSRIFYEPLGFNTRSQAMNIAGRYKGRNNIPLLIVTSPEHVYRAVKTFLKAGFEQVGGLPAFEIPVEAEQVKDKEHAKDKRVKSLALRYNMWSYLNYELLVLREYTAIGYYKVKGWI